MSALALITGPVESSDLLSSSPSTGRETSRTAVAACCSPGRPTGTPWVGPAHLAGREPRTSAREAGLLALRNQPCPRGCSAPGGLVPRSHGQSPLQGPGSPHGHCLLHHHLQTPFLPPKSLWQPLLMHLFSPNLFLCVTDLYTLSFKTH